MPLPFPSGPHATLALAACVLGIAAPGALRAAEAPAPASADVIVYGSTSGAVIAAVAARQEGKTVLLVSPDRHLGGMTSGGLGWTDIGRESILGGLSREFYHRVWLHYQDPAAWRPDGRIEAKNGQHGPAIDDAHQIMLVFEPKVAEAVFDGFVTENAIPVVHARIDLRPGMGVEKEGNRIVALRSDDGRAFRGKIFIDATYEGDLMAQAGVSFATGREPASRYGEPLNGLQVARAVKNQLSPGIDPYVRIGDPSSGLLPGVVPAPVAPDGSGDDRIQAYCYRMCLTDDPENRVPVAKPEGYREDDYELLFRAIAAGQKANFFKLDRMPNRKTDSNNTGGISTDLIGGSQDYPSADYARREEIARAHEAWQRGLVWTLQNSPRVPAAIRAEYSRWGLPKDEFADNGNWSPALYVREARRLVGEAVLTQPLIQHPKAGGRPIALGAYAMDSHHVQRIVGPDGDVRNEGDVQEKPSHPYPIDYGVLLPKRDECANLLVPFCISASHVAFGSVRMEPVFMVLGESAAVAACQAADRGVAVQDVDYASLRERLLVRGQRLEAAAKND